MTGFSLRFAIAAFVITATAGAQQEAPRYPIPAPMYQLRVDSSVMVPMRDGVRLSADLYFPIGASDRLPVVFILTPYNKRGRGTTNRAREFAGQGYVVAAMDVRGKFESEGDYIASAADTKDGYDAIGWLASQSWSTGRVGTYGCSYSGENQMEAGKLRHPSHTAMIPQASGAVLNYFASIRGGAFELAASTDWFRKNGSKVRPVLLPNSDREQLKQAAKYFVLTPDLPRVDYRQALLSLPVIDIMRRVGSPPTDWEGFVSHEPLDPWWDQFGYVKPTDLFDAPALFLDSWYDYGPAQTLALFQQMRRNGQSARARDNQFVVIGPTVHCRYEAATEHTMVGQRDVGDARFDFFGLYLKWFDHWLKGVDNGVLSMPRLQIYVMGRNEWRGENEWPLARTQWTKYYLHSDGSANSRFGTGMLSVAAPGNQPADRFSYDPATPVPSMGGPDWGASNPDLLPGAVDQSTVETRSDVLVYSTPPLLQGVEVTGPLQLVLYVSSDARDTDFTGKLVDVYPDGRAFNVQEGILRARYREGYEKKTTMNPGEVYQVVVDLQVVSNYFPAGHRIRLEVSSSNFPRFDRNLNTGGNNYDETKWVVARNTIHHSARYPSHIVLPVIP